jgi:hypothetical protein
MDLGTIQQKMDSGSYDSDSMQCFRDIVLVWDNCFHYNAPDSDVSKMGVTLQKLFAGLLETSGLFKREEIRYALEPHPFKYFTPPTSPAIPSVDRGTLLPPPHDIKTPGRRGRRPAAEKYEQPSVPPVPSSSSSSASSFSDSSSSLPSAAGFSATMPPRPAPPSGPADDTAPSIALLSDPAFRESIRPNLDDILIPFDGYDVPLTDAEKLAFFTNLKLLPERYQERVVELLQIATPHTALFAGDSILEFDIAFIDTRVLRTAQQFVNMCLARIDETRQLLIQAELDAHGND